MKQIQRSYPSYMSVLSGEEGAYRFHVRELGIVASGADVAAAHSELEKKKQAVFDEFAAAGLVGELPPPRSTTEEGDWLDRYKGFVVRTMIVTAAALIVVVVAMWGARSVVTAGVESLAFGRGGIYLKLIEDKIVDTLGRIADPRNEFSKEKQEKVIENLRVIVRRYKPFVDEVRPLFTGEAGTGAPLPPGR